MGENSLRGRVAVLLVLVALVFQAVSIVSSEDSEQEDLYGGTLRVALKKEVTDQDLNPLTAMDDEAWQVIDLIYDSLVRLKTGANNSVFPEPWLAESWTVVDDDTVYVKLRSGLKWHDMTDVTADDVVYTFSEPGGMKSSLKYGSFLTGLTAFKIGDSNVQFDLSGLENKGWFFTRILTIPIIKDGFDSSSLENGCGPYKYKSFVVEPSTLVSNEVILLSAKGDETMASMKYRFVSGVSFRKNGTAWSDFTSLDQDSGSITIPLLPPTTILNATYYFENKSLTLESFDDYFYKKNPFNRGPYLDEIKYMFYPDNPNTEDFNEGADKAIIDLILRNIDVIGFELTSTQIAGDRYIDVETDLVTKLSDETWKTIEKYDNRTYGSVEAAEAQADDFMRGMEGTFRKRMVYAVEENISANWTIMETFDSLFDAEKFLGDYLDDNPGADLRITIFWFVQEFFLALDDNPGYRVLYLGINTQRTPLDDLYFRLALANLTDRNTHYSLIGTGKDIGHSLVIPENAYWYNSSIPQYKLEHYPEDNAPILAPVNLELDLAGYKDVSNPSGPGSDGYRDMPSGDQLNLTLQIPPITTDPSESAIGASIVDLMNRVGINTTVYQNTWENIQANVSTNQFDLAIGMLETDVDPHFLNDFFHSDEVGSDPNHTNFNNYEPVESIVNETLHYGTIRINETTKMAQLARTNLVPGSEIVYRNDTVWPSSNYTMDYENGTLNVTGPFDFQNDTLNISYEYRLFDHLLEGADSALGFEDRQGFVRDVLGVAARHVPMIPLVYYRVQEAYDRTVYDGWVSMPGGINNFWSYLGVKYIPAGPLTVDVISDTKTLKSNQTATIIIATTDQEGGAVGGVYLELHELNGLGALADTEGYTEADGSFSTRFTAPTISDVTDITIVVKGTVERYYENEGEFSITVYPDLDKLFTSMTREQTTIKSGNITGVTLVVTSEKTGAPVPNANVSIEISPSGSDASVVSYQGMTDNTGTFITDFTANVTTETFFRITAKVSKDGFDDKEAFTSVKVLPIYDTETPPLIGIAEIALIALVAALLVLYLLITVMWAGKKPSEPKEEETVEKDVEEEPEEEAPETKEESEDEVDETESTEDELTDEDRELEEEELKKEKTDSD
jgi:ABC-type transport system substrate-binding protein